MEKLQIIFLCFFVLPLFIYFNFKSSVKSVINDVERNPKYFPKGYVETKRWMRKQFGLKQKIIPKYIYFSLYMANFYIILGPINLIVTFAVGWNKTVCGILVMFHICLAALNMIYFILKTLIYKKY